MKLFLMLKMLLQPHHRTFNFGYNGSKCLGMCHLGHLFHLALVECNVYKNHHSVSHIKGMHLLDKKT